MTNDTNIRRAAMMGGVAVLSGLLLLPATTHAQAETPTQFFACYVPGTGVVYRIKAPGLKVACTGRKHVEFSWAQLVADEDGKVGIGTSEPIAELDVVGDIHASGIISVGNSLVFNGITNTITSSTGVIGNEGTVTATDFVGDGSGLTSVSASDLISGTYTNTLTFTVP